MANTAARESVAAPNPYDARSSPFTYAQTRTEEEIYEPAFKPIAVIERARGLLPIRWKPEILSGVGYGIITEDPGVVNERVLDFIGAQIQAG